MSKSVLLKITAAVSIAGNIVTPGTEIEVEEGLAKNLLSRGRAEPATEKAAAKSEDGGGKSLSKMKVDELKAKAAELGIEGADDMTKDQLIAAIKEAETE